MNIKNIWKSLIISGLLIIVYALNLPVSGKYSDVVNLYLLNKKQNTLIIGVIIFLSGIILFSTFKIKQTKEDEELEFAENNDFKIKAKDNFYRILFYLKNFFIRIVDGRGEYINPILDHPIARLLSALYVGFCLFVLFVDIFDYGAFLCFVVVIILSFRPRAASFVISRVNKINIYLIILNAGVWLIQFFTGVFYYYNYTAMSKLIFIPVSLLLWLYARNRLRTVF